MDPIIVSSQPLTILIVDDDPDSRVLLKRFLKDGGYHVEMAQNGREAVERYPELQPDIILMDVLMPEMDGYHATRAIKALAGERFVPVIFLTAVSDDRALAKCVEYGGDDFLTKPYSRVILRAKIDALERMRGLYATLKEQRDRLADHETRLLREQELAETVFANIARRLSIDAPNIKYRSTPATISNGDLLLVASRPNGAQYALLGDFTGHGLSAALGALPVSDLFSGLAAEGADLRTMVLEINGKLREILPTGLFFAVCLMEFDARRMELSVWNGGIPDLLLRRAADARIERLPSHNLPLGVLDNEFIDLNVDRLAVAQGDRAYAYSDGVIEARGPGDEMFGQARLEACLAGAADSAFERIRDAVDRFRGGQVQEDDITLLELHCTPPETHRAEMG